MTRKSPSGEAAALSLRSPALAPALSALAVAALLTGCAGETLTLYDGTRDKAASQAKTDWQKVDTSGQVAAEQANLKSLLAEELATQGKVAAAERDFHLRSFIDTSLHHVLDKADEDGSCDGLQDLIDQKLDRDLLGWGENHDALLCFKLAAGKTAKSDWQKTHDHLASVLKTRLKAATQQQAHAASFDADQAALYTPWYIRLNVPLPVDCNDVPGETGYSDRLRKALDGSTAIIKGLATKRFDAMRAACATPLVEQADDVSSKSLALYAFNQAPVGSTADPQLSGALKEAFDAYQTALKEQTAAETAEAKAEKVFNAAKKALDAVTTAEKPKSVTDARALVAAKTAATGASSPASAASGAAAITAAPTGISLEVQDKATAFQSAIDALKSLAPVTGGRSAAFLSSQRLAALATINNDVVTGIKKGGAVDGAPKTANAIVLVSGLATDLQRAIADAKEPITLPLQLYEEQQQLIHDASSVEVSTHKAEVALNKQLLQTVIAEITELWSAQVYLDDLQNKRYPDGRTVFSPLATDKGSTCRPAKEPLSRQSPYYVLVACTPPDARLQLVRAAVAYLDVIGRLEADRRKLQYDILDAQYQGSLAYSAVNIKRWESLIDISVNQVADYYAGGIKPDTWASLVQAAMLVIIAHKVH